MNDNKTMSNEQLAMSNCTPNLRFPGFEGEWEVKKLGEVCSINRGVRVTRNDLNNNWSYPVFQNTDSPLGFYNKFNVKANNPFVIIGGSAGLVGFCNTNFWAADDCAYFGDCNNLNSYFLYLTLLFHSLEIKNLIRGGNIPRIDRKSLEQLRVSIPPTLAEQQKIAAFLSELDDEIAAENQQADSLKAHKKGLMQQLFPPMSNEQLAMSNCTPNLRFPGFEGEWEVKKLGEIGELSKGKGISKIDLDVNGMTPCIRYGELYTHYGEQIKNVYSKTNISVQDLILSKANDVIIPSSGETHEDIATASCILNSGIAIGGDINIIRTPLNGLFLSYYLNSAKKQEIAHIAQGDAVVHLYGTQLSKLNICFPPTLAEQQKIADCLSALDEQISAQQQKVDALKEHKKGLMQQLFPSMRNEQ